MATLAELREKAGFPRPEEFAMAAGVAGTTVRNAEKGKAVTLNIAYHFADALGIPRQELGKIEGLTIKSSRKPRIQQQPN